MVTGVGSLDQLLTIGLAAQEIAIDGLFEGRNDAEVAANDRDPACKDQPQNNFASGVMQIRSNSSALKERRSRGEETVNPSSLSRYPPSFRVL